MSEIQYLHSLTVNAIADETARLARVGKASTSWCFGCGRATGDLTHCVCDFPSALRCAGAGKPLCAVCREAHRFIAKFLSGMFAHPPARRVDALRARKFRFLRNALAAIHEKYRDKYAAALKRELSVLDSYLDPRDEFQRDVLDILSRSRFSRWPELSAELGREEKDYYVEAIAMSGILGR